MRVQDIAESFTAALRAGDYDAAEKFWSDDVVSIEQMDGPMARLQGREAVHGKGAWWFDNHTIHSASNEGPFVNGEQFSILFRMDITRKSDGQRVQMTEVGLYTVKGGKITEERFFY